MDLNLLIIDNDAELTDIMTNYLKPEGFNVSCASDGDMGIKKALNQSFDIIVIDLMLPKLNGFEVLQSIRKHSNVPILMLTSRSDDIDRLVSFEIGADDYLQKPCSPHELIARLKAILKRSKHVVIPKSIIDYETIVIDCSQRTVLLSGKLLELTNAEFNILEMLMKSPGQAFSKEELTQYALGRKFTAYDRSIDVHISNLRNKLGLNSLDDDFIKTKRGFGYLFNAPI